MPSSTYPPTFWCVHRRMRRMEEVLGVVGVLEGEKVAEGLRKEGR